MRVTTQLTGKVVPVTVMGEDVEAFIPDDLPPRLYPKLDADCELAIDRAMAALGRLDALATLLPDTSLFLYMYVRKEALLSSQIEGTRSSLSELLLYELDEVPGAPFDDVREVSNYVRAMEHGMAAVRSGGAINTRLILDIHGILLSSGRGSSKRPGKLRIEQNWIHGRRPSDAEYIPPPNREVPRLLKNLEEFIQDKPNLTRPLIKAAIAHVQFETIHPFLDGNGRIGRLLIPLILCRDGVMTEPLLYVSLFIKQHQTEYYRLLQDVRLRGSWVKWIHYFAEAVDSAARSAVDTAKRLQALFEQDREFIRDNFGRPGASILRVHEVIMRRPLLTPQEAADQSGLAQSTTNTAFATLAKSGLAHEVTGRQRGRVFAYTKFLNILSEGTELTED
jgi:Fic family protein